jgi:hypothetical protein
MKAAFLGDVPRGAVKKRIGTPGSAAGNGVFGRTRGAAGNPIDTVKAEI